MQSCDLAFQFSVFAASIVSHSLLCRCETLACSVRLEESKSPVQLHQVCFLELQTATKLYQLCFPISSSIISVLFPRTTISNTKLYQFCFPKSSSVISGLFPRTAISNTKLYEFCFLKSSTVIAVLFPRTTISNTKLYQFVSQYPVQLYQFCFLELQAATQNYISFVS